MSDIDDHLKYFASLGRVELKKRYVAFFHGDETYGIPWSWI